MNFKGEAGRIFFLLAALLLLGNGQLAITDPVEANYTLTAREMLEAGDWLSPRIYGNYWFDKPVFYYWELMVSYLIFGVGNFSSRLPTVIFALLNLALIFWLGKRLYGQRVGLAALAIAGTSLEFWYLGKAVITDMTLMFFFNAALTMFCLGFRENDRRFYLPGYFFAGLAVLTKGPVGLLLPGLIVIVFLLYRGRFRELLHLNWLPGLAVFSLVGCSWYYFMYWRHGSAFLEGFLGVHNYLRATVSEHPRDDVWFYYLLIFLLGFCPWSFMALYQLKKRWRQLKGLKLADHTVFLLTWGLVVNVFFQLMATKYLTYTLPALMPWAILTAKLLEEKWPLVRRTALTTGIILSLLTFGAAVPLCQRRSGIELAESLAAVEKEAVIYNFGDYRASEVFYSRRLIHSLVPEDKLEELKPNGINWNAKNVMPLYPLEKLPRGKGFYIVCDLDRLEKLRGELPGIRWKKLRETGKRVLLRAELPL